MSSSAQGTSSACPGRKGLTKLPGCDRLQTGKFTRQKDEPGQHGYCPALSGAKEVKGDFLDTLGKGTQPSSRALLCPWQPQIFGGNTHFKPAQAQRSLGSHPAVPGGSLELSPLQEDVMLLLHWCPSPTDTSRRNHVALQDVLRNSVLCITLLRMC